MDGCIAKMSKLLIWSENTYKQKKKSKWDGKVRVGSREKKGDEGTVFYEVTFMANFSHFLKKLMKIK
jgi:hypothetical protein